MDNLVARLTHHLAAGDFESHAALLPEYRASVDASLSSATDGSFREELLAAAVRQSNEWLHLAQAMRSHLVEQLILTNGESHYHVGADDRHIIHALG